MAIRETEICLYLKVDNSNFKETKTSESWKQYETKYTDGTRTRLRVYEQKNDENKDNMQVLTIKHEVEDHGGIESSMEYNTNVTKDFSNGFIKMCEHVQHKRRDVYKSNKVTLKLKRGEEVETHTAPEITLEVDRFIVNNGYSEWIKVDVEVQGLLKWIKSNYGIDKVDGYYIEFDEILPCKVLKIIESKTKDDKKIEILDFLWREVFKQPTAKGVS